MVDFTIVATGYNCWDCVKPFVDSVLAQSYRNYRVIIIDDGSSDGTAQEIIALCSRPEWDWAINDVNEGTYYARHTAITGDYRKSLILTKPTENEVIVLCDLDDKLKPGALYQAAQEYEAGKWMTYGNYEYLNGQPCPVSLHYEEAYHKDRSYRKDKTWRCTHLRTFYRKLYEKIPRWELTPAEVNSYPDVHTLFSMMEMCGKERIGVIEQPIYIYNTNNPLSTLKRFGKDYAGYAEIINRPKMDQIFKL